MKRHLLAVGLAVATTPAQAATVNIDFQNLTSDDVFESISYPEVTFTNGMARPVAVLRDFTTNNSEICAVGSNFACTGELVATFAKPVARLGLDVLGVNNLSDVVMFAIDFGNGQSETVNLTNLQLGFSPNRIDLSGFRDVTRFRLTSTDSNGVSIDNVSFAPVPEPTSWALMITGFGLIGGALRGRVRHVAFA